MKSKIQLFGCLALCAGLILSLPGISFADGVQDAINQMGFGAAPGGSGENQDLVVISDPHAAGGDGLGSPQGGGTSAPPSPSDGPKIAEPLTGNMLSGEENLGLAAAILVGDDETADAIYFSGTNFGDEVGVSVTPPMGGPGYPLGGAPVGSWVHFERSLINPNLKISAELSELRQNPDFAEVK